MSNIPITSLPLAIGTLGDDQYVLVQAGTTKRIFFSTITSAIAPSGIVSAIITTGATSGNPFVVPTGINRVLVNKAVGAPTFISFNLSSTYAVPIMIKDFKGDADVNPITISFSGGELADGLSTITLATSYAAIVLNPDPLGGGFYITSA